VVNRDLPWNPAVLEQRIGRVHRLGQTRGVQVVNFVAEGTIEEGMLPVLAFKKLPMPEPQIVREIGEALSRLVSSLANRSE
jgi:hypothetical protein